MSDSLIIAEGAKKVLLDLAKNGPASGYTIFHGNKDEELLRASVYAHLGKLAKKGLVEWQYAAPSRGFLKKKIYSLTLRGLTYVLLIEAIRPKAWKPIVERWAHLLPLVLGKWQVIVEGGNEEYVRHRLLLMLLFAKVEAHAGDLDEMDRLIHAIESSENTQLYPYDLVGDYVLSLSAAELTQYFYGLTEGFLYLFKKETNRRWLQEVCSRDEEIRDFVSQRLSVVLSDLSKKHELVQTMKCLL